MINGFIIKKLANVRSFNDQGKVIVGTVFHTPDLTLTQIKTEAKDKYSSLQFAYGTKKKIDSPTSKKLKKLKLKISPSAFVEFKTVSDSDLKIGDTLSFDQVFSPKDTIDVSGITKGRGFAGAIKRHGFHRQPVTMGASDRTRSTGAIGAQTPGKVVKGKKMPGHYGNIVVTIKNLTILSIDKDKKQVIISGSVPGSKNSWLVAKKPKY